MLLKVECYAGYKGEETPRRFFLGDRKVEVAEVVDRWLAPDHSYFKVLGDDGVIYILRHEEGGGEGGGGEEEDGAWELQMYDQTPPRPEPPLRD